MTKYFTPLILLSLPLISSFAAEPQVGSGETDGYKLVWQDLFDGGELNLDRWVIEVNGDGGGNNELQYYKAENVSVGDDGQGNGCLILTARREDYKGKKFTSGRLNTLHKVTFTHGKVEASIKLPKTANGLWPAFWMMGDDFSEVGWPACGETDILEMGNSNGMNRGTSERYFNGACHWGTRWDQVGDYARDATWDYSLQDNAFHLYTCIWDQNFIRMYVDMDKYPEKAPYYEIDISKIDWNDGWCAGNYFHKPNFIIFDLAIGGNFTGIWDAAKITALNDANGQEASMYVNYLKIYQKGVDNETFHANVPGDDLEDVTPGGTDNPGGTDGIAEVAGNAQEGVTVFNAGGLRVAHAASADEALSRLTPGLYIVKSGNTTKKIIVK
ncbi:MAG: family 16 glycosylhydrolase [Muribaculaceae bacterium]|nr:family 16 glycosylhydrolase [Muribaculaceae bacterium]